jgi:hypothetical protein
MRKSERGPVERLHDWHRLAMDFRRAGVTHAQIAEALNKRESTIRKWFNHGAEPNHSDGERLCAFYKVIFDREPPMRVAEIAFFGKWSRRKYRKPHRVIQGGMTWEQLTLGLHKNA